MRFAFDDDQLGFATALGDLLRQHATAAHVRAVWDAGAGIDRELWGRLAAMGVTGAMVPAADGGLGLTMIDTVLLFEQLGRHVVPGPVVETVAIAGPALAGTEHAPRLAEGTRIATAALDATSFVAHAAVSDLVLTGEGVLTLAGAEVAPVPGLDGGRSLAVVRGGELDHRPVDVVAARHRAAVATAAYLVGAAEAMIEMAAAYARERRQFGTPIGSFQAVKHLLADALVHVEFAKAPTYRAAWSLTVATPDTARDVSMAKALANEAGHAASRAAMQVHGAIGYTWEADLQLWMKKVWALERAYGTTAHHRRVVGAAVLGRADGG